MLEMLRLTLLPYVKLKEDALDGLLKTVVV